MKFKIITLFRNNLYYHEILEEWKNNLHIMNVWFVINWWFVLPSSPYLG